MKLIPILYAIVLIVAYADGSNAQQTGPSFAKSTSDVADSTPAIPEAATEAQIREYLRVSGEVQTFRDSWIAAVDKNRSIGAPYWPESFWQAVKDEMQKTDLVPMYVTLFQHGISRDLMQQVLDAYRVRGAEHFQGSEECSSWEPPWPQCKASLRNSSWMRRKRLFRKFTQSTSHK
jgi:hypothetical protein